MKFQFSAPSILLAGCFVGSWPVMAHAPQASNMFLAPADAPLMEGLSMAEARALAEEIGSLFGEQFTNGRLRHLEDSLRPTYLSLASGQRGLGHTAARYILHRYFQQRHGWLVPGLDPEGGAWNASSPTVILEGRVPSYVQQIFEDRLETGSLDLHGLAVLATTFEHLVRIETVARLEKAFRALEIPTWALLSDVDLKKVLEMNMLATYYGDEVGDDPRALRRIAAIADRKIHDWSQTQLFLQDSRMNLAYAERDAMNPFMRQQPTFDYALHVVEESNSVYGHYQDKECQHLKNLLLPYEYKGTGMVTLARFYGLFRAGYSQFAERKEYLRDLGILDESEPNNPMVRIANWLLSPGNCLGSSAHYSYCCVNECNNIMGHLEHELGAPRVEPQRLAAIVARISSSTVAAPRNLSAVMVGRLHEIAASQGGAVPLHGLLFADWLHHAFPRECPYPHKAGAYRMLGAADWARSSGMSSGVRRSEVEEYGESSDSMDAGHSALFDLDWDPPAKDHETEQLIEWADEEENHIHWDLEVAVVTDTWISLLRLFAKTSAMLGVGGILVQQLRSAHMHAYEPPQKYAV